MCVSKMQPPKTGCSTKKSPPCPKPPVRWPTAKATPVKRATRSKALLVKWRPFQIICISFI